MLKPLLTAALLVSSPAYASIDCWQARDYMACKQYEERLKQQEAEQAQRMQQLIDQRVAAAIDQQRTGCATRIHSGVNAINRDYQARGC